MRSRPRWGTRRRTSGSGFAVPISKPRYTWRASAEITVSGRCAARATASAVFPAAVGPTITMVLAGSAPPKAPLHLVRGKLHDGGPPVHIMGGQRGREQPVDQLPHLFGVESMPGLDRRATREGRRESFEPVLPPAEAAPCQIRDELLQTPLGLEARMGDRKSVV